MTPGRGLSVGGLGVGLALFALALLYFGLGILLPLEWVDEGHVSAPEQSEGGSRDLLDTVTS